ncbi:MAG: KAP family NTPase [Bacteroidales bacterium]|nr:KAP family NTPase [Bacteroidales bacterium]
MANSNEHIEQFLNYYLEKETSPDYAVLITGCWGSGKTYFIKQFLAGKDPNGKNKDVVKISDWLTDCEKYTVVYVSLFGAKSRAEMDQRVLEKLHPILNSELLKTIPGAVSLIGKIIGVLSANPAGVVVGAAGDAGTFAANKIIEAFKQKSKKFEKIVIVFDDVERADMPLPELLGYLNAYVEHLHVPCILLADKEKWEEAQKCQEDKSTLHKLSSTKEKVIGKEFKIQTTFDEVWNHWKEDEHHPVGDRAWKILNDCRDLIKNIVESSSDYNYRALKHSLSDFQRFIGEKKTESEQTKLFIDDKYFEHMEFAELIVADFICYQYAFHVGLLNPLEITNHRKYSEEEMSVEIDQDESKNGAERSKHGDTYFQFEEMFKNIPRISTCPFDSVSFDSVYNSRWSDIWKEWLIKSYVDTERVQKIMDKSIWFNEWDNFAANQLLKYHTLEDEFAKGLLEDIRENLKQKKYTNPNYIFFIFNSLLLLASEGVFEEDVKTCFGKMKEYIENIELEKVPFAGMEGTISSLDKDVQESQKELWNLINGKLPNENLSEEQKYIDYFWTTIKGANYDIGCKILVEKANFPFTKIDLKNFAELYKSNSFREKRGRLAASVVCRFETLAQIHHEDQIRSELSFLKGMDEVVDDVLKQESKPLPPSALALKSLKGITNTIEQRLMKYKGGANAIT